MALKPDNCSFQPGQIDAPRAASLILITADTSIAAPKALLQFLNSQFLIFQMCYAVWRTTSSDANPISEQLLQAFPDVIYEYVPHPTLDHIGEIPDLWDEVMNRLQENDSPIILLASSDYMNHLVTFVVGGCDGDSFDIFPGHQHTFRSQFDLPTNSISTFDWVDDHGPQIKQVGLTFPPDSFPKAKTKPKPSRAEQLRELDAELDAYRARDPRLQLQHQLDATLAAYRNK